MQRLRLSNEVGGDRAEHVRQRPPNLRLLTLPKGSATRHRQRRYRGLAGAETTGEVMLRILPILALALSLVGCTGDRTKQGLNDRQAQPQSIGLLA